MTDETMTHLTKMIREYIDDYHLEGDEGSYTPTRRERLIAEDIINSMLVDDEMADAIRAALSHPAITHCYNCGCDWLDNGLNPVGCPYCKQGTEIERLWVELENWKESFCQAEFRHTTGEERAERLAEALRMMVEMVEMGGFGKAAAMDVARAALRDKGGRP